MGLTQAQKRHAYAAFLCKHGNIVGLDDAYQAADDVMRAFNYGPKEGQTWGCNCRAVTNGTDHSIHSYFGNKTFTTWTGVKVPEALARDTNSVANPYGHILHTDRPRAMQEALDAIRTNSGVPAWLWGGYFSKNHDAMHDEIDCSPADLATGIDWSTVYGHDARPKPPPPHPELTKDDIDMDFIVIPLDDDGQEHTVFGAPVGPQILFSPAGWTELGEGEPEVMGSVEVHGGGEHPIKTYTAKPFAVNLFKHNRKHNPRG